MCEKIPEHVFVCLSVLNMATTDPKKHFHSSHDQSGSVTRRPAWTARPRKSACRDPERGLAEGRGVKLEKLPLGLFKELPDTSASRWSKRVVFEEVCVFSCVGRVSSHL